MAGKAYVGTTQIKKIYAGTTPIKKVFCGTTQVFSSGYMVYYHINTNNIKTVEVDDGADCIANAPTVSVQGWTLQGWREDTVASSTVLPSKTCNQENIHLYAVLKQQVTVTLKGGTSDVTNTGYKYYNNGNTANASIKLSAVAKSGWTLTGYRTDTTTSSSVSYIANNTYTFASNTTLYAIFQATVTVTYYNNSATASTKSGTKYCNYVGTEVGATFNLTVTAVSGWTVRGWSTNSGASAAITYNSATNFTRTSACTLYASWSANVTVTYYNNSSTAGTSTKAMYRGYKGDVTAATFNLTEASVSGWTARGWSTSSAANAGITYNNATNFTRTSACTLYASWSKTVTVSYNGNGNTGGSTSSNTGTAYRGYKGDVTNASITLRGNGFSRTNYTFYRWALNSASGTQYKAGASISLNANATMYAYWLATTVNFGYTGGVQTFDAKAGVTYQLKVWGAQGGHASSYVYVTAKGYYDVNGYGANGGYSVGNKAAANNATWYVVVGGAGASNYKDTSTTTANGGYNGGGGGNTSGDNRGGGGGGATHIGLSNALLRDTAQSNVLIAAGGGGGAGVGGTRDDTHQYYITFGDAGAGGGTDGWNSAPYGTDKSDTWSEYPVCTGGSQIAGGSASLGNRPGSYGQGGSGIAGGGGGLYGGGATGDYGMPAGGGSGYTGGVTSGSMSNGLQPGNGYATITIVSVS